MRLRCGGCAAQSGYRGEELFSDPVSPMVTALDPQLIMIFLELVSYTVDQSKLAFTMVNGFSVDSTMLAFERIRSYFFFVKTSKLDRNTYSDRKPYLGVINR